MRVCVAGPAETHSKGPPGLPAAAGRSADLAELPLLHQRGDRPPQDCCHHSEGRGVCVTVCPIMCSACTPQCECGGVKAELRWRWTIRWKEKNCPLVSFSVEWLIIVCWNKWLFNIQSVHPTHYASAHITHNATEHAVTWGSSPRLVSWWRMASWWRCRKAPGRFGTCSSSQTCCSVPRWRRRLWGESAFICPGHAAYRNLNAHQ